jgi:hypothetical protein
LGAMPILPTAWVVEPVGTCCGPDRMGHRCDMAGRRWTFGTAGRRRGYTRGGPGPGADNSLNPTRAYPSYRSKPVTRIRVV